MKIETVLNNKLSSRKLYMIAAAVGVPLLLAGIIAAFFLIQGTVTNAEEEAPIAVNARAASANEAQITFETASEKTPTIRYGKSPGELTEYVFGSFDLTTHSIKLTGLEPETTYYFSIVLGDKEFDNDGSLWTFTTGPAETEVPLSGEPLPSIEISVTDEDKTATPSPSLTTDNITVIPSGTVSATPSATLKPTISGSPTPTATISATMTPTPANVCKSNNCVSIIAYLGSQCTTQDYLRCIQNVNITITQAPTNTPTPTPIPAALKSTCGLDYVQSNSCRSLIWDDMTVKPQTCADTFTQYFVQCKSTSWESTDPATWYCNEVRSSNQLSLPCANAPTPPPGQSVFCRVRAETTLGGSENATDWVYAQTSCPRISGDDPNCAIDYMQANACTSWIWDNDYQKDPRCSPKFDHYFFQCTDDGDFDSNSFWYCNNTSTSHFADLPCDNVPVPGDGMPITCRVRAEDAYGQESHVSSWAYASSVCPTSTPTPTPSPTYTPTPTP